MGNESSSPSVDGQGAGGFGSKIFDSMCGNVEDVDDESIEGEMPKPKKKSLPTRLWESADAMCISSPINSDRKDGSFLGADEDGADSMVETCSEKINPSSALFARALVSEVTDNPRTMTPAAMAEREKRLLKAQEAAKKANKASKAKGASSSNDGEGPKPVGAPGGVGQPSLLGSIKHALGTSVGSVGSDDDSMPPVHNNSASVLPPNSLRGHRAQAMAGSVSMEPPRGKYAVTIGLSLSRRHSTVGHPDTVTRQTAFDFNELQDRQYKYVSSTDSSGWLAGGGERGGAPSSNPPSIAYSDSDEQLFNSGAKAQPIGHKSAAPDTVHIPIIHINSESPAAVDSIISALARGEVFIPHMGVLPETLSVNGISPPDLVVRFGCERNEDVPPEEWPNWCLEFMHNQLYEYFQNMGAQWMNRPFQITLARKVRWKTVKHMNRYFAHAERVIDAWRERGPQYLDPQLSYIEGGATPEEVARPHGIYLLRNGVPTNYFAPNFDPPYTTKMTRSLLMNVLGKSWDKKRREWTSEPVPRLITPSVLVGAMCGCAETQTGFMANEVTNAIPTSPPAQEYKSLNAAVRTLQRNLPPATSAAAAESKRESPAAMDVSADLALKEEKKADSDSKDEWSPSKSGATSPLVSETGASSSARSSPAARAEPPTRSGTQAVPPNRRYGPSPSPERSRFIRQSSQNNSVAPSEMGMSVAATETTVHHTNSDPVKVMELQRERKEKEEKARREKEEAEGWLKEALEDEGDDEYFNGDGFNFKAQQGPQNNGHVSSISKAAHLKQKDKQGRAKQMTLDGKLKKDNEAAAAAPGAKYIMGANKSTPEVQRSDSGTLSLDYSLDSSLLGDGSLIGQRFDADSVSRTDGSVNTAGNSKNRPYKAMSEDDERTADGSLTIQESGSASSEIVPSDEELFAIGWAKALDPSSGSYYYFTLDRSRTVWDNPLNDPSVFSGASGSEANTLQSI